MAAGALTAHCGVTGRASRAPGSRKRLATFACDVTLPLGTPIYSSYEPLKTIEHPLLAKGVVIEENDTRYVVCAVDWCQLRNSTYDTFRRKVACAAETSEAHVAVQTVHQHTAPISDADVWPFLDTLETPPPYPPAEVFDSAAAVLGEAIRHSLDGLKPFDRVGTGSARVERIASNRRIPAGDGKVGFRASSCRNERLCALPEGLIDPVLQTITFAQGERPLARLHYYATHPQSFYGDPRASYDFVGMARERLEDEEGVFQVYFTGCAGDVAAGKYNDGTPEARQRLYERLYAAMAESSGATRFVSAPTIEWTNADFPLTTRQDEGYTKEDNRTAMADPERRDSSRSGAAMALTYRARAARPIELSAMHLGNVHVVHLPGEPMVEFQLFAKKLRKRDFVAVAGYGDCCVGYICPARAYEEGGYEPTASNLRPESEGPFRAAIGESLRV